MTEREAGQSTCKENKISCIFLGRTNSPGRIENKMYGHLCAHIGYIGPGELPEDGCTPGTRFEIRSLAV